MTSSSSTTKVKPPDGGSSKGRQPDSKIVILGDSGVGKSALVVRFLTNRFIGEYDPTLERTYRHNIVLDEEPTLIEILDTAGQPSHDEMTSPNTEVNVRWGDGFVLVYAINDRSSFESAICLKQHLDQVKKTNTLCMLVGNKVDLLHERRVGEEEAEMKAGELSCAAWEVSASEGGEDIPDIFYELHRDIRRRKAMDTKGRRRSSAQQVKSVFNRMLNKIGNSS